MRKICSIILFLLLGVSSSAFTQEQDHIRFSLMTCSPGKEIYSLFGHTAIRYENYTRNIDVVFNYGLFSFNTPHFVWRFVKGETDYQLGVIPYPFFEREYAERGSDVYQQVLDFTPEENLRLLALLDENYLPQNRVYRYNYFYDNCTTRARDCIEAAVEGRIVYPSAFPDKSFRSIVHEYTANSEWDELGIDLCLGREADTPIGERLQMFAPFYMRSYASRAYILDGRGEKRLLIREEFKAVHAEALHKSGGFPLSPMMCASLFLLVCVSLSWIQWKKRKIWWGWDCVLLFAQGVSGCIIAFLFFFSVHPTVGSNWLLMLFNPLPLLYIPLMLYRAIRHKKDLYSQINVVYLTLFIILVPICGQKINLSVLPLALGLMINSVSHILVWKKRE